MTMEMQRRTTAAALLLVAALIPPLAGAGDRKAYCSDTAKAMFRACGGEIEDDYWQAAALCINVADGAERRRCGDEAKIAREEGAQLCRDQRESRRGACTRLGEDRYDPTLLPTMFRGDYTSATGLNRYFPLKVGNRWEYVGTAETSSSEVLSARKLIEGVSCIVLRDTVLVNGELHEDTDDWYAQAKDGNVWYFGEEVKDYESFDGDVPRAPELTRIDGSFKVGRNRAKAGIIFPSNPSVGSLIREEFSLGNAEDVSDVLSTTYSPGSDPVLDHLVPTALATLLCNHDCVVTKNTNLREPGAFALKYYAPGIGFFLEASPSSGNILQLTSCNMDPRCASLPRP